MGPGWHWTGTGRWLLAQAQPAIDLAGGSHTQGATGTVLGVLALGLLAVALIALGWFGRHTIAVLWRRAPKTPGTNLQAKTRRRIEEAHAQGDHAVAGDLLARAGKHLEAGASYAQAGAHIKAAESFQRARNKAQAIHHYKKAGEYAMAAKLYVEDGKWRAAAAEYTSAGAFDLAGEQYAKAGDDRRAAENYERAGDHLLAAKHYEKSDQLSLAAAHYTQHLDAIVPKDAAVPELGAQVRGIFERAGNLYRDLHDLEVACTLFRRGGFYKEAAECMRTTGDVAKAAEMLIEANQPLLAASYLEEAGESERAASMRAKEALERGDTDAAATALLAANQPAQAAALYVQMNQHARAAALYEEIGQHDQAIDLFVKANQVGHAARCAEASEQTMRAATLYEQVGDVEGQMRMLRKQGDFFRVGRMLFEHRRHDDALKDLERIDSRDPLYLKSLELQGDVLRAQNRHERAYSRYRTALGTRGVGPGTLPLFYKMALALEAMEDPSGAIQNYAQVVEVEPGYEDASERLKALREGMRRAANRPPGAGSGLFHGGGDPESTKRYEILEEIARGGMGIVYKARDTVLGRVVAYKILGENLRDNETAVKYFLREARAAAALAHPNIVTIFDAGEQSQEYYMAMEFVEGTTLKELIRRSGALPEDQTRFVMMNSCRALQYAHSKNVIHRDIKSGNIMITRDRTLKIMDFGLAKFLSSYQNNHTQQVGTPFYMSPEQIIGKDIDFRSDLYSLGCMAFECATGTVPFFKGDLSYHHIHTPPPTPRSINPGVSKKLEAIILRLLEKDPQDRFQDAGEVMKVMG